MVNANRILVEKPAGNRRLGRPSHKWLDNIKTILKEIRLEDVNWIHIAEVRDKWRSVCCDYDNGTSGFTKGREFFDQLNEYSVSGRTLLHGLSSLANANTYS
jgi:hypothetical protein